MHYCQTCGEPIPMEPYEGGARCPACGRIDAAAAVEPLFVVTGASASGKTTVFPHVSRLLAGRCITFDMDWLLDAATELSHAETLKSIDWAAYRSAWLAVAHGVAQSGLPTVLFGPLIPDHLAELPNRKWIGDIHFLLLDCPDDIRKRRIEARPPWRSRDIETQTSFGNWLREHIAEQVDTSRASPEEVATAVVGWVTTSLKAKSTSR
jgi:adenylate kinase